MRWLTPLLALAVGCAGPPPVPTGAPQPPGPTLCQDDQGSKDVGAPCTNSTRCDCSGPSPTCLSSIDLGEGLTLPNGYCSNSGCEVSSPSCGNGGVCVGLSSGPLCLQRCNHGTCRTGYACLYVAVEPDNPLGRTARVCLPESGIVECDPTKDPATQCATVRGTPVSTLTNGAPNAACLRIGPDDVGQCRFLPCAIGPGNCPAREGKGYGCFYLDVQRHIENPNPADRWKGPVCLPIPMAQKSEGAPCDPQAGFNSCGDNLFCDRGTCRQLCLSGPAPSYPGGDPMYKHPPSPCPSGRTCRDAFSIGGASWPGLCLP